MIILGPESIHLLAFFCYHPQFQPLKTSLSFVILFLLVKPAMFVGSIPIVPKSSHFLSKAIHFSWINWVVSPWFPPFFWSYWGGLGQHQRAAAAVGCGLLPHPPGHGKERDILGICWVNFGVKSCPVSILYQLIDPWDSWYWKWMIGYELYEPPFSVSAVPTIHGYWHVDLLDLFGRFGLMAMRHVFVVFAIDFGRFLRLWPVAGCGWGSGHYMTLPPQGVKYWWHVARPESRVSQTPGVHHIPDGKKHQLGIFPETHPNSILSCFQCALGHCWKHWPSPFSWRRSAGGFGFHNGISCFILQLSKVGSLEVHGSVHLMSTGKWVHDWIIFLARFFQLTSAMSKVLLTGSFQRPGQLGMYHTVLPNIMHHPQAIWASC